MNFFSLKETSMVINLLKSVLMKEENLVFAKNLFSNFGINKDPELGIKLGGIIQKYGLGIEIRPFYEKSYTKPSSQPFFCRDKTLKWLFLKEQQSSLNQKSH